MEFTPVRVADVNDIGAIITLCEMLYEENGEKTFRLSIQKMKSTVENVLNKRGGVMGIIGDGEEVWGMICLVLEAPWYSDDFGLYELFNFVHPAHRASNYAKSLIVFAKAQSDKLSIPLDIGVLSNIRTEAKCRLYRSILPKIGEFFRYVPGADLAPVGRPRTRELNRQKRAKIDG